MPSLNFSEDVLVLNPDLVRLTKAGKINLKLTARPEALKAEPTFKSKTEARAWREWAPTVGAALMLYEPITLHLMGGRYTPDFVFVFENGEVFLVEVKGSWQAYQSGRSSKRSLKQAAEEFAWLGRWFSVMPVPRDQGGGWRVEEFGLKVSTR